MNTSALKRSVFAIAVIAGTAFASTASAGGLPLPIFECLYPPGTPNNVCRTDWIFVPLFY